MIMENLLQNMKFLQEWWTVCDQRQHFHSLPTQTNSVQSHYKPSKQNLRGVNFFL